jgi:DNA modification methylase
LVYEYDWAVRKNPQSQAIRTRSRELQFAGLESDRAKSRGCLPDYLIKFRTPGENLIPVDSKGQVSRNDWIQWAEGCWGDINHTDTLNVAEGRGERDTKHICPLQLPVIRRLVRLYSNPDEIVFSPFAGIGSEGYASLLLGRRFYGCEIKDEYIRAAKENCTKAVSKEHEQLGLFQEAI